MTILDEIERWARSEFETRNAAREKALSQSRELTRTCANTIRAVHRRDYEQAEKLLTAARTLSDGLTQNLAPYPDLFYTGYVQDAQKEYVEATVTLSLISGAPMPSPQEIGVAAAPFLNGPLQADTLELLWVSDHIGIQATFEVVPQPSIRPGALRTPGAPAAVAALRPHTAREAVLNRDDEAVPGQRTKRQRA